VPSCLQLMANDWLIFHHRARVPARQTAARRSLCYNHCFFKSLEGLLYRHLERRLSQHAREFLLRTYGLELPKIVIEQPPQVQMGEYALPLAFELA